MSQRKRCKVFSYPAVLATLLLAACTQPPAAPTATRMPTATPEPTTAPPPQDAGLFPSYELTYDTRSKQWASLTPDGETAATWDSELVQWIYDFEIFAADESINIFDPTTFPERFSAIANNWLEAPESDRALYQEFVEAARDAFFEKGRNC